MSGIYERFLFASAPDSWGVLDYPGPSWEQSYEKMLDEMVEAGYSGSELGPYGFFPTDPAVLQPQLEKRKLKLLASFVPVKMTDPSAGAAVIERIRKVGHLLATLKAPFLVIADDQSTERNAYSGRAYDPGCPTLSADQWKHIGNIVADAEKVANEFGLCLDTGHCVYGFGDSVKEAEKYKDKLRFVHIKDCNTAVLEEARRNKWTFEEAIEHQVFTIIGQGNIDFPAFFRTLLTNNYSGWSVVEQDVKFGHTPIPPKNSIAASLKYLRGVVGNLSASAKA